MLLCNKIMFILKTKTRLKQICIQFKGYSHKLKNVQILRNLGPHPKSAIM